MAIRIRKSGEILCAAYSEPEEGDTYIDDRLHRYLHTFTGAIRASDDHFNDHLWFWNILPEQQEEVNLEQEWWKDNFDKV